MNELEFLRNYYNLPDEERKKADISKYPILQYFNNLPIEEQKKGAKELRFNLPTIPTKPTITELPTKPEPIAKAGLLEFLPFKPKKEPITLPKSMQEIEKQVGAASIYSAIGILKGLSGGYFDAGKLFDLKSIEKEKIDKNIALTSGYVAGAIIPIGIVSRSVGTILKASGVFNAVRPVLQSLAQATATGLIYGVAKKPEEEGVANRLKEGLDTSATFIVFTGSGALLDKAVRYFKVGKMNLYNSLRQDIINKFKVAGATPEQAEKMADIGLKEAINTKGSWANVTKNDIKTAKDNVAKWGQKITGKEAVKPAEIITPKGLPTPEPMPVGLGEIAKITPAVPVIPPKPIIPAVTPPAVVTPQIPTIPPVVEGIEAVKPVVSQKESLAMEYLAKDHKMTVSEFQKAISLYNPQTAVEKSGDKYRVKTISGNDFRSLYATKKEAIAMAERHLKLYKDKLENPEGYLSNESAYKLQQETKPIPAPQPKPTIPEAIPKEAWEMTREESIVSQMKTDKPYNKIKEVLGDTVLEPMVRWHKQQIQQALSEGKPVPEIVLKDYPELQKQVIPKELEPLAVEATKPNTIEEFADLEKRIDIANDKFTKALNEKGRDSIEYKTAKNEFGKLQLLRSDTTLPKSELDRYNKTFDDTVASRRAATPEEKVILNTGARINNMDKFEKPEPSKQVKPEITPPVEIKSAINRHPEEKLAKDSTEPEFLDKGPDIGLAVKKIIPTSMNITSEEKEIPIIIEKEPKDLIGLSGWFRSWVAPVRFIAGNNPVAQKIAHLGRDTITFMNNETREYTNRIEKSLKGLNKDERQQIAQLLDRTLTEKEIEVLPDKLYNAYSELDIIRWEMLELIEEGKLANVGSWSIPTDAYYPHIFVGQYQIVDGKETIPGGFAKTLEEALDKTKEYLKTHSTAEIKIKPRDIGGEYTATLLTRKGFHKFISAIEEATTIEKDEIMGLMKGVAAIKPRPKFVGNFMQRIANLEGFIDDPELAFKIYTSRIIRKKWLDPFSKKASNWATELPPGLRQYFTEYIDDVRGKYNPIDKNYVISRNIGLLTKAQTFLKLGYRPSTAFVNRLQPFHTGYSEIGNYIFLGEKFKFTKEGKEIIELSGIRGQSAKYYALEFISGSETPIYKPLGMFSKAEMANREQVIAGGYLFAKKVFAIPEDEAIKTGYQYILDYSDYYSIRENYLPYQVEHYAKIGLPATGKIPREVAKKIAAIEYAKDFNADSNYIYDISDLPKLLRTMMGRPVFQFKNYTINFLFQSSKWIREAVKNPNPHNTARAVRLIGSNIAIGGIKTPIRIAQWFAPRRIMNKILLALLLGAVTHKDERVRKVYKTIYFGAMSHLGIDLSERIAPDIYIPQRPQDIFGPTASDIVKITDDVRKGEKPLKIILRPWILGKDIYEFFEQPKGVLVGYRQRNMIEANEWERYLEVLGFTPIELGIQREISKIARDEKQLLRERETVYIDQFIESIENKEPEKGNKLLKKAREEGIIITREQVKREIRQKKMNEEQRRVKLLPKELKRKFLQFSGPRQ